MRQLREAAFQSVRSDPGLHQLVPYFVNFIANQVTHRLDDTFVLRQMMELTDALLDNDNLFLDPYASPLSAPVLTCLMSRKLRADEGGADAVAEQYQLREFAAGILGKIARNYSKSNTRLRPKLTRTCLKYFLDPTKPPAVHFGAVNGLSAAGGPMAVRVLLMSSLKSFDDMILGPLLRDQSGRASKSEIDSLMRAIVKVIETVVKGDVEMDGVVNGALDSISNAQATGDEALRELEAFVGPNIGRAVWELKNGQLNRQVLESKRFKEE